MKITDYHRQKGAEYYKMLIGKYGIAAVVRNAPRIKRVIWTRAGLKLTERRQGR